MDLVKHILKEPEVGNLTQYRRRVRILACVFTLMFGLSLVANILLLTRVRHLVILAQRSNVETLTIAFFLLFFTYLMFVSLPGALGSAQILYYHLARRIRDPLSVEKARQRRLMMPEEESDAAVATNVAIEKEGNPYEPLELKIEDEAGSVGVLRIDGSRIEHITRLKDGSNSLFVYFVERVLELLKARGVRTGIEIVSWKKLDDEEMEKFLSMAKFARNLERRMDAGELWPKVVLTAGECARLEKLLSELCHVLRTEAFLPHWEYEASHKLPIIPEPLGIVSLTRTEKRVDPLASMCACFVVMLLAFGTLIYLLVSPPWVPGK